nr:unnamed protein product [Digitaria exilis]
MPAGKSHKGVPAAAPASGGDRIGALPDEILHRVLSFLPAQQAVRTCVLSRRWLHLWKYATGLRVVGADGKEPAPFEEVREFVDSLLLLRGSSPLERFEVKVAGAAIDVRNLRLWVRYGMMCNVQFIFRRDLKCCPTFSRLKTLVLFERCIPALTCILEHSPVLEIFKLFALPLEKGFIVNVKMSGSFNPAKLPSTVSPHLKIVKVRCGTVDERVLEILEFLSKFNISMIFFWQHSHTFYISDIWLKIFWKLK